MILNWADWSIVALIAVSVLYGLNRGFIKEALSLVIWFIAASVAWRYGANFSAYLAPYIQLPSMQVVAASALVFVLTVALGSLVSYLLETLVQVSGLGGLDRLLGMLFGLARGALLIALAVSLLALTPFQQDPWWRESVLLPEFLKLADWSKQYLFSFFGLSNGAALPSRLPFPL